MKIKDGGATEKLLACAKAEFMEKGFAESSMRTIAERAGVTTGMLYSRFADKDEMFRTLVKEGALPPFPRNSRKGRCTHTHRARCA